MKKNFLKAAALSLLIASCSEDDFVGDVPNPIDPVDNPTAVASVVLNEVEYLGNRVEIFNNGDVDVDVSGYFLCLGSGTYRQVGSLEAQGDTNLSPGEFLVVSYDMPNVQGGLGLYVDNSGFGNASTLADFVQWGAAGSPRENVAVEAGIWTAGDFVPVRGNENYSIIFDGEGNGVANWAETTTVTFGEENILTMPAEMRQSIVLNEVQYASRDLVEIYNNGNVAVDLSSYWLCLGPGTYVQLGNVTPVSGNLELAAGEFLVVPYTMPDVAGGLGLYSTNAFASADAIVDFVQWGAAGSPRENVAVEAGIWTAGDFVPTVTLSSASIEYDGEGDASSDWNQEVNPSFGLPNDTVNATTTFNVTISNVINYLNVHSFTERTNFVTGESVGRGPLNNADFQYQVQFKAVPGTKFTPVTMMGNSNDWFLAPEDFAGIDLFPNGQALTGDIAGELILFDLGTEADNLPEFFPPAGANVGPADANNLARIVDRQGRNGATYLTAELKYEASADGQSAGTFTFTIRPVANMLPNPDFPASSENGFVATPGIVVLHTMPEPVFTLGQPDRGVGLEAIAEDGNPDPLFDWFTETGSNGSPIRLASSLSVFSPGLVYAFNTDSDPWFTQGAADRPESGLSYLAEDGNNAFAVDYLKSLGVIVTPSNETENIGPGESLTFTIEVPQGQNYKLGFGTMLVETNDWFISHNNDGVPFFLENGTPYSGVSESDETYLFDAGTEIDEAVGFGIYQAPRQNGPNEGPLDPNTTIRRVSNLEDVQFGKGVYNNPPGVTWLGDPRGGYNLIEVDVQPQ